MDSTQEGAVDSVSTVMSVVSDTSYEGDMSQSPALLPRFSLDKFLQEDAPPTTNHSEDKESPVIPVLRFNNDVTRERTCAMLQFEPSGLPNEQSTQFRSDSDPDDASQSLFTTTSSATTAAVANHNDDGDDKTVKDGSLLSQRKSPIQESQFNTQAADDSAEEETLRDTIETLCERLVPTADVGHKPGTNPALMSHLDTSTSTSRFETAAQEQPQDFIREDLVTENGNVALKHKNIAAKQGPENADLENQNDSLMIPCRQVAEELVRPSLNSSRDVGKNSNDPGIMSCKKHSGLSADHTRSSPAFTDDGRNVGSYHDVLNFNPTTCRDGAKYQPSNVASAGRDPPTKKCAQKFKVPYYTQKAESLCSTIQESPVVEKQWTRARSEQCFTSNIGSDSPIGTTRKTKGKDDDDGIGKNRQNTRNVVPIRKHGECTKSIDPIKANRETVLNVDLVGENGDPTSLVNPIGKKGRNADSVTKNEEVNENNHTTKKTTGPHKTPNNSPFTSSGEVTLSCGQAVVADVEVAQIGEVIRKRNNATRMDDPGHAGENTRRSNPVQNRAEHTGNGDLITAEAKPDRKGEEEAGNDNVIVIDDCSDVTLPPESDEQLTQSSPLRPKELKLTSSLCSPQARQDTDSPEVQDIMHIVSKISQTVFQQRLDHAKELHTIEQIRQVCDQTSTVSLTANDKGSVVQSLEKVIRQLNKYQQEEKTNLAEKVKQGRMSAKEKSIAKQRLQSLSQRCAALREVFQAHHQLKKAAKSTQMNNNDRPATSLNTSGPKNNDVATRTISAHPRAGEVRSAKQDARAVTRQKTTKKTPRTDATLPRLQESRTDGTLQRLQESHTDGTLQRLQESRTDGALQRLQESRTDEALPRLQRSRTDDRLLQRMQRSRTDHSLQWAQNSRNHSTADTEDVMRSFSGKAPSSESKSSACGIETDNFSSEAPVCSGQSHKSYIARSNNEDNENTSGISKDADNVVDSCSEMSQSILLPKPQLRPNHSASLPVSPLGTTIKRRHSQVPVLKCKPVSESLPGTLNLNPKKATESKRPGISAVESHQLQCVTAYSPSARSQQPSVDKHSSEPCFPKGSPGTPDLSRPLPSTLSKRPTSLTGPNEGDSRTKGDGYSQDVSHGEVRDTEGTESIEEERVQQLEHEDGGSRVLVNVHGNEFMDTQEISTLLEAELDSAVLTDPSTQVSCEVPMDCQDTEVASVTQAQTCVTSAAPLHRAEERSRKSAQISQDTVEASQSILLNHDILAARVKSRTQQNGTENRRDKREMCSSVMERPCNDDYSQSEHDNYSQSESPKDNVQSRGLGERKDIRPRREPASPRSRKEMGSKSSNGLSPKQPDSQPAKSSRSNRKRPIPSPPAPESAGDDVTVRKSAKTDDDFPQPRDKRMKSPSENEEKELSRVTGQQDVLSALSAWSRGQAGDNISTDHTPPDHKGTGSSESIARDTTNVTKTPADGNNTLSVSQRPNSGQTGTCVRSGDLTITSATAHEQPDIYSSSRVSGSHAVTATEYGQPVIEVRICHESQGSLTSKPSQRNRDTSQTQQTTHPKSQSSQTLAVVPTDYGALDHVQSLGPNPSENKATIDNAAVQSRKANREACPGNSASRPAPLSSAHRRPSSPSSTATSMTDVFPVSSKEILRRMAEDDADKRDNPRSKELNLKPSTAIVYARPASSNSACEDSTGGRDGVLGLLGKGLNAAHASDGEGGEMSSDVASRGSVASAPLAEPAELVWQSGPKQLPPGTKVVRIRKVTKNQTEKKTTKGTYGGSKRTPGTFQAMVNSGAVQPGKLNLSLLWDGSERKASILADGRIKDSAGLTFPNPLSWFRAVTGMTHAKRPSAYDKIRYNGHPLATLSEVSRVSKTPTPTPTLDRSPPPNLNRPTTTILPPPSTNPHPSKMPPPPNPPQRPAAHSTHSQTAGANGSQKNRCGKQAGPASQSSRQRCEDHLPVSNQPPRSLASLPPSEGAIPSLLLSSASIVASLRRVRLIEDGEVVLHTADSELASFWSADFAKVTVSPSIWATVDSWD